VGENSLTQGAGWAVGLEMEASMVLPGRSLVCPASGP
jgi:hypothetical protein